jgi:hypothetical protein
METYLQKETDVETEKSIYYDSMRFGDSNIVRSLSGHGCHGSLALTEFQDITYGTR